MAKKQITKTVLAKLKAETAHCAPLDGFPADYIAAFAQPSEGGACLCCGETGTFTWGLAHGSGHCFECGWPARLYHFVKGEDGNETRIVRLLQYHPDEISIGAAS